MGGNVNFSDLVSKAKELCSDPNVYRGHELNTKLVKDIKLPEREGE